MKKKWLGLRVGVSMCAALGWWGLLYPELALTPDTVEISVEEEDGSLRPLSDEWSFDKDLYLELLGACSDKITFRSRLLMNLKLFWETFHESDGSENTGGTVK